MPPPRPTRDEVAAAYGRTIRDVIAPGLRVLFVGINPGLYSGATGHHFARPGNRFWKALHGAGFTDRLYSPFEDRSLPELGIGVTNLVARTTATADELTSEELREGARKLERKVRRHRPAVVAVVGVTAYRVAFGQPRAKVGLQEEVLAGARIWVLPNPSGRTAAYQLPQLIEAFSALASWLD
ncbi:MAG: G/U mismatch-specific DNA glycosylase [Actinomycetota bacterium]